MTPAEIKKTRLYRTLAPCVRKGDREELARMLSLIQVTPGRVSFDTPSLWGAFVWNHTPQGHDYWWTLARRLRAAGHDC